MRWCRMFLLAVWAGTVPGSWTQRQISDACDWVQSGSTDSSGRQVRVVYLRCSQGHVQWKYPQGALRVVLQLGTSGREFRGCVRVERRARGTRIFLEGGGNRGGALHPLYSVGDSRDLHLPRCFDSLRGRAALYVEASDSASTRRGGVELHYDLREAEHSYWASECRPCNERRLMQLFCSSDFAARGRMVALRRNKALKRTEVLVRLLALFKQSAPIFGVKGSRASSPTCNPLNAPTELQLHHGVLYFPLHCQVARGPGEFMFLGRLQFGCPMVACAPRWEDWRRAWTGAAQRGLLPCRTPGFGNIVTP